MNAPRKTKPAKCKACQRAFESVYRYSASTPRFRWDDICEACTCLYLALSEMQEARDLLAQAKELWKTMETAK